MHSKPVVNSLEELIEQLRDLFDSDQVDIDAVKQLLKSYQSNPLDWSKYTLHDPKRSVIFYLNFICRVQFLL